MKRGKIYPCTELPNMIFALKDKKRDLTLNFILTGSDIPDRLENVFKETFVYDKLLGYKKHQRLKDEDYQSHEVHIGFSYEERKRISKDYQSFLSRNTLWWI